MIKERSKIVQFVKEINELFTQKEYKEINYKFENNTPDLDSFYSLSARAKYIHSVVLREVTQSYQLWFQESSICLSPNYLPYIPKEYFDEWVDIFYSVDKEGCSQWLPRGISLKSVKNEHTFLKVDASFSKKIIFEGETAEIKVSMISTLPKEISDASIAVQVLSRTANENENNSNKYISKIKQQVITIAEHQSITPNKRLFFKSDVCLVDQTDDVIIIELADVILIINSVKLIFNIEPVKINRSKNPNKSKEIRIEPKDIGCSLFADMHPPGFVDVPAPIHLKLSTSDYAGYSITLNISCPEEDQQETFISLKPDMSSKIENIKIDVEKPFKEYDLTFYAFSHIPKEIKLEINWYDKRNGKNGKMLPLRFNYPFKHKSTIFNESSSCRTEINIQKTPLLTESSYSILTEFTSNCPWPVTIKSFEIIPENENKKDEIEYLKSRFLNVESDAIEIDNRNNNPAIIFQKPIINLPMLLEPNDKFSAFTKFSTNKKECMSTNIGFLLIRYVMHSTIYKGVHLYVFKLTSSENMIVNKKINMITPPPPMNIINYNNNNNHTKKLSTLLSLLPIKDNKNNSSNILLSPRFLTSNNGNLTTETNNNNNNANLISIEKLKLKVEFNFPSRGSQFEMCELTLKLTNVSDTPLETVLNINHKITDDFLMAGTLNTQMGLFPFEPTEISLKFFPLAHGSLTFPEISINSAQSYNYCYWSAKPTIFISYPAAS